MSPDDKLRLASWVKGLFPEATLEQASYLADEFSAYDVSVVESVVRRFRRLHDSLNIRDLLRRIADEQERRNPRASNRDEEREAEADRKREDAVLSKLTDDDWNRETQAILDSKRTLRTFLSDRDPRKSPTIRAMILSRRLKNS